MNNEDRGRDITDKNIFLLQTDTCYGLACPLDDTKSYELIYKIKRRSLDKPLAIMVPDFKWLRENTDLTDEQVDFLEAYKKPFTVLTDSSVINMLFNFEADDNYYINKDVYENFAFRVANIPSQTKLIEEVGPIFLTSANFSGKKEIYSRKELESTFDYFLNKIKIIGAKFLDDKIKPSDIIEFEGNSLDVNYLRK